MTANRSILVERLTEEAFAPFGTVIGVKPQAGDPLLFGSDTVKWRTAHNFDPGEGGVTEFVWVNYGRKPLMVEKLECHRLTQQAFIPLGGSVPLIHVLAPPADDVMADEIYPDMSRAQAFLIDGSMGVSLKRGCWHAHFSLGEWANWLMITRRSTTVEIEASKGGDGALQKLTETVVREVTDAQGRGYPLHLSA